MKIFLSILRHLITLPSDLFGWFLLLLARLFWGRRMFWYKGALHTVIKNDSWPMNENKLRGGWYKKWGGTTLTPHAILLSEQGMYLSVIEHEHQHSRQGVVTNAAILVPIIFIMAIWSWWFGLILWSLYGILVVAGSYFEAWSYGVDPYHDNVPEQHAKAMTKNVPVVPFEPILNNKKEMPEWE